MFGRIASPNGWLVGVGLSLCALPLASACSTAASSAPPDATPGGSVGSSGGAVDHEPDSGSDAPIGGAGGTQADGGDAPQGGTSGVGGEAGESGQAGVGVRGGVGDTVENGAASVSVAPRPAFGALVVASDGERTYVVESRRDVDPGPFGLPWRTRFRLAAYDAGVFSWAYAADPDDIIGDVVVHPSGDVTLSLERQPPDRLSYELVRLSHGGDVILDAPLVESPKIPAEDYAATDPRPLFRMKADLGDATTAGWVRLLPDGDGLVVAFLSFVDVTSSRKMAIGLSTFDWQAGAYAERWARVVEGTHSAEPTAWAYDELRWLDQAVRPFLARDESTGDLLVGRAWNMTRCQANVRTFAEFTAQDCALGAVGVQENERLPLAVTRFEAGGARLGTRILAPDDDAAEQLAFGLAARGGELAVVGSVVRTLPGGAKRTYPDANGYVDYDGYIGIYDAEGRPLSHHDFNLGRGDMLASLRWTNDGIAAVGAAGWDRWQGGMSISRGADPLFVWLSADGASFATRVITLSDGTRHFNLHDLLVEGSRVTAFGFSDAPMTHSDGGNDPAARTFGPLTIGLSAP